MAFGQNPTTSAQGSPLPNQFPVASVAVPGKLNGDLTAMEGGPESTDSNGNKTAPASIYVKDGNNVSQGSKADAAATDSTSSWSIISVLKGIYAKIASQIQAGNADGLQPLGIQAVQPYLYNGGGPTLANGAVSMLALGRPKSLQNAAVGTSINSTTSGDTTLTFPSAPKTVAPGAAIKLHTSGYAAQEWVFVSPSYVPTATSTVIPLASPVVNSGCIGAIWEQFDDAGPRSSALLTNGIGLNASVTYDPSSGNYYIFSALTSDGGAANSLLGSTSSLFNGSTVDRARGNMDGITLVSAAGVTGTQTSADQVNYNGRGVKVWFNITTFGAALTLHIDYKDPVSGIYLQDALVSTAIAANGFTQYTIYPGIATVANVSLNDVLPRSWRVRVTGAGTSTFTVGATVLL